MSKTVRFLIGLSGAGKTHARTSIPSLAGLPCVDLADIQNELSRADRDMPTFEMVELSYKVALDRLLEELAVSDDVVFEHTLVKSHRRPYYIDGIRAEYPDARLVCYYVHPDEETYVDQYAGDDLDADVLGNEFLKRFAEGIQEKRRQRARDCHAMFDIPSDREGFDEVVKLG